LSEAKKAFYGSLTLTFSRLSERLLGLISTLITARLLMPEDFGIVAIAMIVIAFFTVLGLTGSTQYIIQKDTISESDVNTAWTIDVMVKSTIFLVLLAIAPLVSDYYDDERLTDVIYALSIMSLLSGFTNPALMLKQREQSYKVILILDVVKKLFAIVTVITIAYLYRNYWAMVLGHIMSNFIGLIGSYIVVKYKPKFCLEGLKQQWLFTRWMLAKGFLGYFRAQIDTILVSNFFGTSQVGAYHVTKYIATMPGSQVVTPATTPLLASFSRTKNKPEDFEHQIKLTFLVLQLIALPMSAFLFTFSLPFVEVLLGKNWVDYHHIFGILALLTMSLSIGNVSSQIIVAKGRVKSLFYYDLLSFLAIVAVLFSLNNVELSTFAWSRVAIDWLTILLLFSFSLKKFTSINITKTLLAFLISGSVAFGLTLVSELLFMEDLGQLLALAVSGLVFIIMWILYSVLAFKCYYSKLQEGAHLYFLISKVVMSVKSKLLS
jgi:O-antigen/teichoic acid export membrane protein